MVHKVIPEKIADMKELIVYYSMSGNTEDTAKKIASLRGADLLRIDPVKAYPDKGFRKFFWGGKSAVMAEKPELKSYYFKAEDYDRIIIGTPVWASTFAPPIRTFLSENKEVLRTKRLAAFACQSGNGAEKAFSRMAELLGTDHFDAELILIDPLTHSDEADGAKITEFCSALDQ